MLPRNFPERVNQRCKDALILVAISAIIGALWGFVAWLAAGPAWGVGVATVAMAICLVILCANYAGAER